MNLDKKLLNTNDIDNDIKHEEDEEDHQSTDESEDSLDVDNIRDAYNTNAHDYIVGEEDYDPEKLLNCKAYIKSKWRDFYRNRLIDLQLYKIERKVSELREDASEILLNLCKSKSVSIYDVIDLLELGASTNFVERKTFHHIHVDEDDPQVMEKPSGKTCLHYCAKRGHVHILWALLQKDMNTNVNATDHRNSTALMIACDSAMPHQAEVVRILLKQPNIKLNIRDSGGNTALLNCIYKGNIWVLRELLLYSPQKNNIYPISVLERQEKEDPNAYEISQFIFCNGLLMQPIEMDSFILEPATTKFHECTFNKKLKYLYWKLFSLKGTYKNKLLLYLQSILNYDQLLAFRMIQNKSYEEGRIPTKLIKKTFNKDEIIHEDEDIVDHSKDNIIVNNRHQEFNEKYYKPKKLKKIKLIQTKEERIKAQLLVILFIYIL